MHLLDCIHQKSELPSDNCKRNCSETLISWLWMTRSSAQRIWLSENQTLNFSGEPILVSCGLLGDAPPVGFFFIKKNICLSFQEFLAVAWKHLHSMLPHVPRSFILFDLATLFSSGCFLLHHPLHYLYANTTLSHTSPLFFAPPNDILWNQIGELIWVNKALSLWHILLLQEFLKQEWGNVLGLHMKHYLHKGHFAQCHNTKSSFFWTILLPPKKILWILRRGGIVWTLTPIIALSKSLSYQYQMIGTYKLINILA